jgi:hypothetical protein
MTVPKHAVAPSRRASLGPDEVERLRLGSSSSSGSDSHGFTLDELALWLLAADTQSCVP